MNYDYLAKKREYVFLNNRNALVRIHTFKVKNTKFDLWTESYGKKYRDTINMLEKVLPILEKETLPPIVLVNQEKLGIKAISAYDHQKDVIYFNVKNDNLKKVDNELKDYPFVAKDLKDIFKHELGHKKHWDAVKRFYQANKSRYNNIEEAKNELDSSILKYIKVQNSLDELYLNTVVSAYAAESFRQAKINRNHQNIINEIIAEVCVIGTTKDPKLNKLIRKGTQLWKN